MRTGLILLAVWLALLALAAGAAWRSADLAPVRAEREAAHARFAAIPLEEFTRDRANRMSGRVLDGRGKPLVDASIRVYDFDACLRAASGAAPGAWPSPEPERQTRTDASGDYELADLDYGAKLVLAVSPGHRSHAVAPISFADGYGAPETDFVLRAEPPRRFRLLRADGSPAAGEELRLLPRLFGLPERRAVAGADGWIEVPIESECADGPPRALWGAPPVLLAALPEPGGELTLPPSAALRVEISGGDPEQGISLEFEPGSARRIGRWTRELAAGETAAELAAVDAASWNVTAVQGELRARGRARAGAAGEVLRLDLARPRALALRAAGEDGAPLAAVFQVQESPPVAPPAFGSDPLAWSEHADPTAVVLESGADGIARGAARFAGAGWVIAAAPEHAPRAEPLPAGATERMLVLPHAHEIAIKTDRPYLPVLAEAAGSPPAFGRSDAAAETFVLAGPGPLVARAGIARGGATMPRGSLVGGDGDSTLRFNALDEPGSPRGSLHGFVLTPQGEPCADAEVWIQGADGRPQSEKTDAQGWYRFTQLEAGLYVGFVAPPEAEGLWMREPALVPLESAGAGAGRLDLRLHAGVVELAPDVHLLPAGAEAALRTAEGAELWAGTIPADRRLRLTRVPDGDYLLCEALAAGPRVIGALAVRAALGPATRLEPER